jgi:ABC-2 type transport system ATP-binding protein
MTAAFLDVIDLSKHYGARPALDRVRFSVQPGEMFGLLGPNGAGKTTLLSIVSCLLEPDSGEVRLQGRRVTRSDLAIRRQIGVVPQELAVYPELTARENLTFFGELYGLRGAALGRRVEEILRAIGLSDRADQRTSTFSGGMKRRLNLGAALAHEPPLLLLDEPTVGVDPQSRHFLFEEVRRLNASGMTVIYTSHYMEEVQGLCSRVGIMDKGRLVACDTLPNLLHLSEGRVRFRVEALTAAVWRALQALPDCKVVSPTQEPVVGGEWVELRCRDVAATLLHLGAALRDAGAEARDITTEEPHLEDVFLRLTGTALRA